MKIFRFLLTLFHLVIIVLLLGTLLNDYIPPRVFPWVNMLSLSFPVLMILNVLFCIFWLVLWKKRVFLFLLLSSFLVNPTRRWLNYSDTAHEKANLKIVSVNIKGGTLFGYQKVYDYLKTTDADIILAQEYASEFKVPGYEHRTDAYEIVALNSKIKILEQGKIATVGNGNSFFADVEVNGKKIRLINVYLSPFSFDKGKVKPSEDLDKNKLKLRYVVRKLVPTFKNHQDEVADIQRAVSESPYPVILAGDFNAVPNSYEYYQIAKKLKDVFVETGIGSATSFHDYKFPIRIDYVFCSPELKPISYKVDRSAKVSDHFPVISEFKID